MNLSRWISARLRPLSLKAGNGAAVIIAVAGVALTVMVLEFTIAITSGFKDGIKQKLMGFDAQITVLPPLGAEQDGFLHFDASLDSLIESVLPGVDATLSLRQPGMLKTDNDFEGVIYFGVDPKANDAFERSMIVDGSWPEYSTDSLDNVIVISKSMSDALSLKVGDRVYSTYIIDGNVKLRRHIIGGIYKSDFSDYDKTVVFTSLAALQKVVGVDSLSANRLEIRGLDDSEIDLAATNLQQELISAAARGVLDQYYPVNDVHRSGALYFNWLKLLDTNVLVIFILMLAVAGFTLISSLFILILERLPLIGVLRALGASKKLIKNIFINIGLRLVGAGMIIGNVLGVGLLIVQQHTHLIKLDPEMYYLSWVPVQINPISFVALNIGVIIAAWLILVLPSKIAANMQPSKIIYTK